LHPNEIKQLADLQKDKSPEEQQRLADAACYLVHCSRSLDPQSSGYAAALESEQRGASNISEQITLQATGNLLNNTHNNSRINLENIGMFNYTPMDAVSDAIVGLYYDPIGSLAGAKQGAINLFNILANGHSGTPQLPLDYPGDGPRPSGGAAAVVTPPVILWTPAGFILTPPVSVPGGAPSNWTFSTNTGDQGQGVDATKGGIGAGEAAGAATVKPGGTVELFTSERGAQVPGAVGVGPKDAAAVAADARNMANIPSNSQARVIANNPYISPTGNMMDFLPEAARITESSGEIVINGTARNPYFNSIPTAQQLDALGLKISYQGELLPEFQGMKFTTTQGGNIPPSSMNTIIFTKK
jgi:hypothetical protein